jgi:hypothetical protein
VKSEALPSIHEDLSYELTSITTSRVSSIISLSNRRILWCFINNNVAPVSERDDPMADNNTFLIADEAAAPDTSYWVYEAYVSPGVVG